jgi:uncharacterized protein YegP (UPF0339 family)
MQQFSDSPSISVVGAGVAGTWRALLFAKAGCENGIESVKRASHEETSFVRSTTKDGQTYFYLRASNGQEIGRSETYGSKESMENGILSVKTNAPLAQVHYM